MTGLQIELHLCMLPRDIHFRILELAGEGSQGRVFKALRIDRRTGLKQVVALKILHSRTAVDLWKQEFESLSQVRSPSCVQVLAFERIRGRMALVLEWVDGLSLQKLIELGILTLPEVAEIKVQIEAGLSDLAAQGIAHGDLSPRNVMIDISGRVRLLDFGHANESRTTRAFAAPARLSGQRANLASDRFSLARILDRWPEVETFATQTSHPQRQRRLAAKIRAARQTSNGATDRILRLGFKSLRYARVLACGLAFVTLNVRGATSQTLCPQVTLALEVASVEIRTQAWVELRVDGRAIGFSPLKITVASGRPHLLRWRTARGEGVLRLFLRSGERLSLQDRDFSH